MTSRLSDRYRFVILTARMSRHLKRRERRGNVEVIRCGLGTRWDKHLYPAFAAPAALGQIRRADIVHTVMVNAAAVVARGLRLVARRPSLLTLQMGDDDAYMLIRHNGQLIGGMIDAAVINRDAEISQWVTVMSVDGPASKSSESAGIVHSPSPPGKYGLPVNPAKTSAAARLNVLWPDT